ncbi:MAG: hypothetical protein Q3972_05795 [Corynebacterium sp.]|nr:hypothetical protein [Corynebacterium sp.]
MSHGKQSIASMMARMMISSTLAVSTAASMVAITSITASEASALTANDYNAGWQYRYYNPDGTTSDNGGDTPEYVTNSALAIAGDNSTNFTRTTNFQIQSSTGEYKKYVSPGDSILYDVTFTNTGSTTWAGFALPSTIRPGIDTAEVILNVPGQSPRRINSAVLAANEMTRYVRSGATYYMGSIPPGASIQLKAKGTAGNLDLDKNWFAEESETTTWYTYQMMPELVLARNSNICTAAVDARGLCRSSASTETRTFWNNNLKTNTYISAIPQFKSNLFLPSIATLSSRNTLPSNSTEIVFRVTNSAGKVFIDTRNYIYDSKTQTSKATQALVPYDTYTADGRYRDIPIYREVKTLSDATAKGVLSFEYTPQKNNDPVVVARKNAVDSIYNIPTGDGLTGITIAQRDAALASLINASTVEAVNKIVLDLSNSAAKATAVAEIEKMTYLTPSQKQQAKDAIAAQNSTADIQRTVKEWAVTDANQNTTLTTGTLGTVIATIRDSSTPVTNLWRIAEPDKSQNINHKSRVDALTTLINSMTYLSNDQKREAVGELLNAPESDGTNGYYPVFKKWALLNNSQNTTKTASEKNDGAAAINAAGATNKAQTDTGNATGTIPAALQLINDMKYLTTKQKEDYSNAIKGANNAADIAAQIKQAALDNTTSNTTMTEGDKDVARAAINKNDATNAQRTNISNGTGNAAAAADALAKIKGLKYLSTPSTVASGTTSDITNAEAELSKIKSTAEIDPIFRKYAVLNADKNPTLSTEERDAAKSTANAATISNSSSIDNATTQTNADGYKVTAKGYFSQFQYLDASQKSAYEAAIDASTVKTKAEIDAVIKTWAKNNLAKNGTQTAAEKEASTTTIDAGTTSALDAIKASNRSGLRQQVNDAIAALNRMTYISKSGAGNDLDAAKARLERATSVNDINAVIRDYATINASKNTTMSTEDRSEATSVINAADITKSATIDSAVTGTNKDGYKKTSAEPQLLKLKYLTGTQPTDAKTELYKAEIASNTQIDELVKRWALTNNNQNTSKSAGQRTADATTINSENTSMLAAVTLSNQDGLARYVQNARDLIDKLGYLKASDKTAFDKAKADTDLQTTKDAIDNLVKSAASSNAGFNTTMTDGEKAAAKSTLANQAPAAAVDTSNGQGIKAKADAATTAIKALKYLNDGQRSAAEAALKQVTTEAQIDAIKRQYAQLNSDQNPTLSTEDKEANKQYISNTANAADDAMTRSEQDGFKTTAIKLIGDLKYLTEPERSAAETLIKKSETATNDQITAVVRDYAAKNADKNTTMTSGDKATANSTLATQSAADAVATSNGTGHQAYADTSGGLIEKLTYLDEPTKQRYKTQIDQKDNTGDMDAVVIAAATENAGKNSTMTDGEKAAAKTALANQAPSTAVDTSNAEGIKSYADAANNLIGQLGYIPNQQQGFKDEVNQATSKAAIDEIIKRATEANTDANTTMSTEDKAAAKDAIAAAIPANGSTDPKVSTADLNAAVTASNKQGYKTTAKGYFDQFNYLKDPSQKTAYDQAIDADSVQSNADIDGVIKNWAKTNLENNGTQTAGEKSASTTKIEDGNTTALQAIAASNRVGLTEKVNAAIAELGKLNYLTTSGANNDMDAAKGELAKATSEDAINQVFQKYAQRNADQNTTMSSEDKAAAKAIAATATLDNANSVSSAISETNKDGYKKTAEGYINAMTYLGDKKAEAIAEIYEASTADKSAIDAVVKKYAKTNTDLNTTQTPGEKAATKTLIDQAETTAEAAKNASNREGLAEYAKSSKELVDKLAYLKSADNTAFEKAKTDIDNATSKEDMDNIVKEAAKANAGNNTTMTGGQKAAAQAAIAGQNPSQAVDTSNETGIKAQADTANGLIGQLKYLKDGQPEAAKNEIDSKTTVEDINAVVKKWADTNTDQNPTLSTEDKTAYKAVIDNVDTTPAAAVAKSNEDGYKTTAKGLIAKLKYLKDQQPKTAADEIDDAAIQSKDQIDGIVKKWASTNAGQNDTMTVGQQNKAKADIPSQSAATAVETSNAQGIKAYADNAKDTQIDALDYLTTEKETYKTQIDNALSEQAVDQIVKTAAKDNLGKNNFQTAGEKKVSTAAIDSGTAADSVATSNRKGLAADTAAALAKISQLNYLSTDGDVPAGTQSDIAKATAELAEVTSKDQIDTIFQKYAALNADQNSTMSTEDKTAAKNVAARAAFANAQSIDDAIKATNADGFKVTAKKNIDDLKYLDGAAKRAAQDLIDAADTATKAQITQVVRDTAAKNADANTTMTLGDKQLAKDTLATQDAATAVATSNATGNLEHANAADKLIDQLSYLDTDQKKAYKDQIAQQTSTAAIDAVVIAAAKDNASKNWTMSQGQKQKAQSDIDSQTPEKAVETSNARGIQADVILAQTDIGKLRYLTEAQQEAASDALDQVTTLEQIEQIEREYALTNSNQNTTLSTEDKQANSDFINDKSNTPKSVMERSNEDGYKTTATGYINDMNYLDASTDKAAAIKTIMDSGTATVADIDAVVKQWAKTNADQNTTMTNGEKTKAKNDVDASAVNKAAEITNRTGLIQDANVAKNLIDELKYLKDATDEESVKILADAKAAIDNSTSTTTMDEAVRTAAKRNTLLNPTKTEGQKAADNASIDGLSNREAVDLSNKDGIQPHATAAGVLVDKLTYLSQPERNEWKKQIAQQTTTEAIDALVKQAAVANTKANTTMSDEDKATTTAQINESATSTSDAVDASNADGYKVTAKALIDDLKYLDANQKQAAKDAIDLSTTATNKQIDNVVREWAAVNANQNSTMTKGQKAKAKRELADQEAAVAVETSNAKGLIEEANAAKGLIDNLKYLKASDPVALQGFKDAVDNATDTATMDKAVRDAAILNAGYNTTMTEGEKAKAQAAIPTETPAAAVETSNAEGLKAKADEAYTAIAKLKYLDDDDKLNAENALKTITSQDEIETIKRNYAQINSDQNTTLSSEDRDAYDVFIADTNNSADQAMAKSNEDGYKAEAKTMLEALKYLSEPQLEEAVAELMNTSVATKAQIDDVVRKWAKTNVDANFTNTPGDKNGDKRSIDSATALQAVRISNEDGNLAFAKYVNDLIDQLKFIDTPAKDALKQDVLNEDNEEGMRNILLDAARTNTDNNPTQTAAEKAATKYFIDTTVATATEDAKATDAVQASNKQGIKPEADAAEEAIRNLKYLSDDQRREAAMDLTMVTKAEQIDTIKRQYALYNSAQNTTLSTEDKAANTTYINDTEHTTADEALAQSDEDGYKTTAKGYIADMLYLTKPDQVNEANAKIDLATTASEAEIDAVVKEFAAKNADQNTTMTNGEKKQAKEAIKPQSAQESVATTNREGLITYANNSKDLVSQLKYLPAAADHEGDPAAITQANTVIDNATTEEAMDAAVRVAAKRNAELNDTMTTGQQTAAKAAITAATPEESVKISNEQGIKTYADQVDALIDSLNYLSTDEKRDYKAEVAAAITTTKIDEILKRAAVANTNANPTMSDEDKATATAKINDSDTDNPTAVETSNAAGYKTTAKNIIGQLQYLSAPVQVTAANNEIDAANITTNAQIEAIVRKYAKTNADQNSTMTLGEQTKAKSDVDANPIANAPEITNRAGLTPQANAAKNLIDQLNYLKQTDNQPGDQTAIDAAIKAINDATDTNTMDEAVRTAAKRNTDLNGTKTQGQKDQVKNQITTATPEKAVELSNAEGLKAKADDADTLIGTLKYLNNAEKKVYTDRIAAATDEQTINQAVKDAALQNTQQNTTMSTEDKATTTQNINNEATTPTEATTASNADGRKATAKQQIKDMTYLTDVQRREANDAIDKATTLTDEDIDNVVRTYALTNTDQNTTMTRGEKNQAKAQIPSQTAQQSVSTSNRPGLRTQADNAKSLVSQLKYIKTADTTAVDTANNAIEDATDTQTMDEAVRTAAKRNAELNTTMTLGEQNTAKDKITDATPQDAVSISNADGINQYADDSDAILDTLKYLDDAATRPYKDRIAQQTTKEAIDAIVKEAAVANTNANKTMSTEDKDQATQQINSTDTPPSAAATLSNANGYKTSTKTLLGTLQYLSPEQLKAARDEVDDANTQSKQQIDDVVRKYAAINADQNRTMTKGEKAKAKETLKNQDAQEAVNTSNANGLIEQANAAKALVNQLNYLKTTDSQQGDPEAIQAAIDAIDNATDTTTMDDAVRTAAKRNVALNSTMTDGDKAKATEAIDTPQTPDQAVNTSNSTGIKAAADKATTDIQALKYLTDNQRTDVATALTKVTTQDEIDAIKRQYAQYNSDQNTTLSTEDKAKNTEFIANSANTPDQAMEQSGKDGYKSTIKQLLTTLKYLDKTTEIPAAQAEVDDPNTASNAQIDAVVRTYAAQNAEKNTTMTRGEKDQAKETLKTQGAQAAVDTSNAEGNKANANTADALIDKLAYLTTEKQGYKDRIAQATTPEAINEIVLEAARDNVSKNTTMTDGDKAKANQKIDTPQSPEDAVNTSNGAGIKATADKATTDIQALKYLTTDQRNGVKTALTQVTTQAEIDAIKREYAQYNSNQNPTLSTEDKAKNTAFIADTANTPDQAMEQSGKDGYKSTIKQLLSTLKYLNKDTQLPQAQAEVDKADIQSNADIDKVLRTWAATNADQNTTMTPGEKTKAKETLKDQDAQDAADTSNANGHIEQANAAKALIDQLNYLKATNGQPGDQNAIQAAYTAIDNATDTDTMDEAVRTAAKRNAELNTTKTLGQQNETKDQITTASPQEAVNISNATGNKDAANAADALIDQLTYLSEPEKQAYKDQIAQKTTPADMDAVVKAAALDNTDKNSTMSTEDKTAAKTLINESTTTPQDAVTASNKDGYKTTIKQLMTTLMYLTQDDQLPKAQAAVDDAAVKSNADIDTVLRTWAATNADQNSTMTQGEKDQAKSILAGQDVNTAAATSNADGIKTYADEADALIAKLKYQDANQKRAFTERIAASTTKAQIDAIVKEAARDNTNANTTMSTEDKGAAISTIFQDLTSTSDAVDKSNEDGYKTTMKQLLTTLKYLTQDDQLPKAQAAVDDASVESKDQIDAVVRTWAETNADQNKTMTAGDKELAKATLRYQDVNAAVDTSNADGNLAYATKANELIDKLLYLDDKAKQEYKDQIAQRTSEYAIDNLVRQAAADNADVNPTMTDGDKVTAKNTLATQSPSDAVDTSNGTGNLDDAKAAYEVIDKLNYLSDEQKAQAKKDINNAPNADALAQVVTDALNTNANQNTTMTNEDKAAAQQVVTSGSTDEAVTATNANGQKTTAKGLIDQLKYLTDAQKEEAHKLIDAATTNQDVYQVVYDYANTNVDQNTTMTPGNRVVAKSEISTETPAEAVVTSNADGDSKAAEAANALIDSMKYLTEAQKEEAKANVANAPDQDAIDQAVKNAALTNTDQNTTMSSEEKQSTTTFINGDSTPAAATAASNADGQKTAAKQLIDELNYLTDAEKQQYKDKIDSPTTVTNADILQVVKEAALDNTDANPTLTDAEKLETKIEIAAPSVTGAEAVAKSNEIGENGTLDDIKDAAKNFIDSLTNLTDAEKLIKKNEVDAGTNYNEVLNTAKEAARQDINSSSYGSAADLADPLSQVDEATNISSLKKATTEAVKIDASALIDSLTNLTDAEKLEAKQNIANADSTPAAINMARNAVRQDLGGMVQRTSDADADEAELQDAKNIADLGRVDVSSLREDVSAAIDKLGNLTPEQKASAQASLPNTTTLALINALTSVVRSNVNTMPTPGTTPTAGTVAGLLAGSLADFKTAAINAVNNLPNLTADEKAAAIATITAASDEVSALTTVNAVMSTDVSRLTHLSDEQRAAAQEATKNALTLSSSVNNNLTSSKEDAIIRIHSLRNISEEQRRDYLYQVTSATAPNAVLEVSDAAKAEDDAILAAAMSRAKAGVERAQAILDKVKYTRATEGLKVDFDSFRTQLSELLDAAAHGDITAAELDAKLAELTQAQDALDGVEPEEPQTSGNGINWPLIGGAAVGIAALGAGIAGLLGRDAGSNPIAGDQLAGAPNSSGNAQSPQSARPLQDAQPNQQNELAQQAQDAQQAEQSNQGQQNQNQQSASSALARTGSDLYSPIFWGVLLMLMGGAAYAAGRRRRPLLAGGRHHRDEDADSDSETHPLILRARSRFGSHRLPRRHSKDS